jgi:hypothetical protein
MIEIPKKRKIVQIAASAMASADDNRPSDTIYALCDDGSLWWLDFWTTSSPKCWQLVEEIPQRDIRSGENT